MASKEAVELGGPGVAGGRSFLSTEGIQATRFKHQQEPNREFNWEPRQHVASTVENVAAWEVVVQVESAESEPPLSPNIALDGNGTPTVKTSMVGEVSLDPKVADGCRRRVGNRRQTPNATLAKRVHRCAPLGLMVAESGYVEGFLPATLRPKRPRRSLAAKLRLQPIPFDGNANSIQPATEPGAGRASRQSIVESKQQRQDACDDRGERLGDASSGCGIDGSPHGTAICTPSLDILTYEYRGSTASISENHPLQSTPSAMGPDSPSLEPIGGPKAAKGHGGSEMTSAILGSSSRGKQVTNGGTTIAAGEGGKAPNGSNEGAISQRNTKLMRETRGCAAIWSGRGLEAEKEKLGENDPRIADGSDAGGRFATWPASETIKGARTMSTMTKQDLRDVVIPMALPGEAHQMDFGAAAKAVVLASGSSRFNVSRYARGKVLPSRVELPWRPPLKPPWRTKDGVTLEEQRPDQVGERQAWQLYRHQQQQHWDLHHAALEIQRAWRGYLARAAFWTEGGVGLHAVATRIQRIFRGWRGKVRAVQALLEKRARAATVITALGRGFQGRQDARRLRVNWHNAAAAKIQGYFRARAARRWMEQLHLVAAIQGATRVQAVWRGSAARRRFRSLHLDQSMEEKVLKAICLDYTGRKGWTTNAQTRTPRLRSTSESLAGVSVFMPALPEGFAVRSDPSNPIGLKITCAICEGQSSRKESRMADGETAPSEAPPTGDVAACKPRAGTIAGGVFGGALHYPCQPQQVLRASPKGLPRRYPANVDGGVQTECMTCAIGSSASRGCRDGRGPPDAGDSSGGGGDSAAADSCVTPAAVAICCVRAGPVVESQVLPSDRYYVGYGHCLLVGAGSGALDEAAEEAIAGGRSGGYGGPSTIKDSGGARARARIREKNRTRGYGDALEVFQEGLRRFPSSAALLYGASLAMQATWFTDGRGTAPTEAMLEASFSLLAQAWAQDPDRRAYREVEAYFLAATRIARRRLLFAETQAAVAREAAFAEKRNTKELSAKGGAKNGGKGARAGLTQRLAGGSGGEREQQTDDEQEEQKDKKIQEIGREEEEDEDEPEDVTVCRKAAAVATFHVALWGQIANGNHDMDLRRSETLAAYRRTERLFSKAMQLDASFELPEIKASERVFSSFYRVRSRLLTTRPLRLKLPPHPEPSTTEKGESAGDESSTPRGLSDLPADPAAWSLQDQQQQRQPQQTEEQQNLDEQHIQHLHGQDRQLQQHEQGQRQQQQEPEQQQHQTKQQQQLIKSILVDTPLGKTLSPSSPKRPHVARRIANRVVTAVREGTKIILRISPRSSPRSPRAAGPFMLEAARSDAGGKTPAYQSPEEQDTPQHPQQELGSGAILQDSGQSAGSDGGGLEEAAVEGSASKLPISQAEGRPPGALAIRTRARVTDKNVGATGNGTNASLPKPVAAQFHQTSLRLTATAWRCGTKLVLRVNERRDVDDIVGGTGAGDGGSSPPSGAGGSLSGPTVKEGEETPLIKDGGTIRRATETSSPLGAGGSATIIVHEAEMERLLVAAVEEQVADGRPRELVEAKEPFRVISEYFIGKVVLLPEFDKDPRYKFSSSRSIRSRKGGFSAGLGHFSIALPYLQAMREQQAEKSARDDGARVLQRAFGGLLARSKCRLVCYDVLEAMEEICQQGRRLLEEDIMRQKESDAARCIQGAWKGWKLRINLSELKSAAKVVQRCFRRLEAKRAAEKAERDRLEGPEVLTVYHGGTVISGVPLMLSVLRCGYSYKFVGRDQEACWAHHGYCYEFEVGKIVQHHNRRYAEGHRGDTFLTGRVGPIDPSRHKKIVEMLVSRLALVDALPAPTTELRGQHRYKTLVVQTTDLSLTVDSDHGSLPSATTGAIEVYRPVRGDVISQRGDRVNVVPIVHLFGRRDARIRPKGPWNLSCWGRARKGSPRHQSPREEELEEVSEETGKVGRIEKETGVHAAPPEHSVAKLVVIDILTHALKASVLSHP